MLFCRNPPIIAAYKGAVVMAEFLSIGWGGVGQAVPERCADTGLEHSPFVIKSDGTYRLEKGSLEPYDTDPAFWERDEVVGGVEVAFVTIPSDQDQRELEVIERLHERGITVVTAAKGALSQHFEQLEPVIDDIGTSAAVGGGIRMIPHLLDRLNPRVDQIHLIPNGTINYVVDAVDGGDTPDQAVEQAVAAGYAEPGATDPLDVINGEVIGDVPKKAAILYNLALRQALGLENIITPDDIGARPLTPDSLGQLVAEAGDRRYILSLVRGDQAETEERDGLADFRTKELDEGWVITGGFRKLSGNPLFERHMRVPGAWNVLLTSEGPNEADGVIPLAGPGAGPGPTAAAMVQDARHRLKTGLELAED